MWEGAREGDGIGSEYEEGGVEGGEGIESEKEEGGRVEEWDVSRDSIGRGGWVYSEREIEGEGMRFES